MTGLLNRIDRVLHDQTGVALLAAVLAMGVLGFLGVTFAGLVVEHQYAAVNQGQSLKALYLAEAGFELVIQELVENQDKVFNGAAADLVIGGITNVPLGAGTVSVAKGTQTPPVFTATGTVGEIRRVIAMTIDVKNLVTVDPVFNDDVNLNLPTNWQQTVVNPGGTSGIASTANGCCSPNALRASNTPGEFDAYREQTLSPTIPPGSRIVVRSNYMRDRTGSVTTVDRQMLELRLVRTGGLTDTVWSTGTAAVSDADKLVWKLADFRGWGPSPSVIEKVRLVYGIDVSGAAPPGSQAIGWFDNIQVIWVKKSAWGEP